MLVQTNFGGKLTMGGVPVWRELTPRAEGGSAFAPAAAGAAANKIHPRSRMDLT